MKIKKVFKKNSLYLGKYSETIVKLGKAKRDMYCTDNEVAWRNCDKNAGVFEVSKTIRT